MPYKVLSLKWRPQTFDNIEGQTPIKKALVNAIKNQTLHPALIFSGSKGTGKTSTARIVAKALKCDHLKGGEPCNKCDSCQSIIDGKCVDVIEIDGASNNGVDSIRDLKDSVQYMPAQGDKRIYIIDEVHMLTTSAFNALLKTLEEPPSHITFIMATTELKKIPPTVLSRCQIFYFRPIPITLIHKRLKTIAKEEKIKVDEEALWMIVEQSQHSMRDAQVLLDQMASMENGKISKESIIQVLALTPRSFIYSILKSLIKKDRQALLNHIPGLSSIDSEDFLKQLLVQIRNLLLISMESNISLPFLMESEKTLLIQLSKQSSKEELHLLFDMCLKGRQDLIKSFDPLITLEMVLLRMVCAPRLESLFERSSFPPEETTSSAPALSQKKELEDQVIRKTSVPKKESKEDMNVYKNWQDFRIFLEKTDPRFAAEINSFSIECLDSNKLILGYTESMLFLEDKIKEKRFINKIQKHIKEFFEITPAIHFQITQQSNVRSEDLKLAQEKRKKQVKKILSNPEAQKVQNLFGAQVVEDSTHLMSLKSRNVPSKENN